MIKKIEKIVVIFLVVIAIGLSYLYFGSATSNVLSGDKAAKLALTFINNYMLEPGIEAELVGKVTQEKGLYKFIINIDGQEVSSYITKDGTMLFPQGGVDITIEQRLPQDLPQDLPQNLPQDLLPQDLPQDLLPQDLPQDLLPQVEEPTYDEDSNVDDISDTP